MALTTTITEELTLDGSDCGASASIEQGNVVYYESKIFPLANTGVNDHNVLYRCTDGGHNDEDIGIKYDYNKVKYARITNLDASDDCTISIKTRLSTGHSYFQIKIGAGGSFIIGDHSQFMHSTTTASHQVVEQVSALGSGVDVEVFMGLEA